jgi:hypothetical protein
LLRRGIFQGEKRQSTHGKAIEGLEEKIAAREREKRGPGETGSELLSTLHAPQFGCSNVETFATRTQRPSRFS